MKEYWYPQIQQFCGNCKNHDRDNSYCPLYPDEEKYEEDTCDDGWEEIDYETQRTDAAERENHRHETED